MAAVVCPPSIWGADRGTGSTRSHQIYELGRLTLEQGSEITIHSGPKTFWNNIHTHVLARFYLELIESAATELEGGIGAATWGNKGYYFAENGIHYWQDFAKWIAEEAEKQGVLTSGSQKLVSEEVVSRWLGLRC